MSLEEVVDEHAASFEAQHTCVAFIDEPVQFGRRNLWDEFSSLCILAVLFLFSSLTVHSFSMLSQFIFSLKLFPTLGTHVLSSVRMFHHVDFQFVLRSKAFKAHGARKSFFCVKGSNVLPNKRVLCKVLLTVGTGENPVMPMNVNMVLQTGNLFKLL